MGEKKVVNRNIAVALALLCIVLIGATVGTVIYYGNPYASTRSHTDSEYVSLTAQLATANENISALNNQLSNLQSEIANNGSGSTDLQARVDFLTNQLISTNATIKTIQDYYNSLIYVYSTDSHDLSVELTTANNQISSLQTQTSALNAIANLTASNVWVNNQTVNQTAGNYTIWPETTDYAGYVSIQVASSTAAITYANVTYFSHGVNYNTQTNVGTGGTAYFPILPSSNINVAVGNGLQSGSATENVTITYYY